MNTKSLKPLIVVLGLTVISLICFSTLSKMNEEKLRLKNIDSKNNQENDPQAQALFHKGKYKKDLAKKRAFVEKQKNLIEKVNVKSK